MYQIIGEDNKTYLLPSEEKYAPLAASFNKLAKDGELHGTFFDITLPNKIAQIAFDGKFDRGERAYYHHCKYVANYYETGNYELYVVGMLHDLLEDCPEWTVEMLYSLFSKEIVDAIILLTKKDGQDYDEYIDNIKCNELARKIKMADLKHNMDITRLPKFTQKDFERLQKYYKSYFKLINFN